MPYRTGFVSWCADGNPADPDGSHPLTLSALAASGAGLVGHSLVLEPSPASRRALPDDTAPGLGDMYRAEVLSPEIPAGFAASEAIPSWNALTPPGTWVEVALSARVDGRWTRWFDHGIWASDSATLAPRSIDGEDDEQGRVSTDTLILATAADAFRLRILLCATEGAMPPELRCLALTWSERKPSPPPPPSAAGLRDRILEDVPRWSQMNYPDGGRVWCSPTSLSMVMACWRVRRGEALPDEESLVRRTVAGTWDSVFEGHGNWSFNAAWAGAEGFVASVRRFPSLAAVEPWIAAGWPVIMSVSWNEGKGRPLSGAPMTSSSGHLTTLVGFDASGDPVMNEPASPDDASVRRVYRRAELEARWLEASGGATYLVGPARP